MCFSRKTFSRSEQAREAREGPDPSLSDREHEAEWSRPVADRERTERDAEETREKIPVGAGT